MATLGYCGFYRCNVEKVENGFIITTNDGKLVAKTEKELFNLLSNLFKKE